MIINVRYRVIVETWYGSEPRTICARRSYYHNIHNACKFIDRLLELRNTGKDWHVAIGFEDVQEGTVTFIAEV